MERRPDVAGFLVEERTSFPTTVEIDDWVRKAQGGCGESFGRLYSEFHPRVLKYVTCRIGPNDAEDVTSQAFLKAFSGLPKFEVREGVPFSGWLFRIAHNEAVDYWRSRKDIIAAHGGLEDRSIFADLERVEEIIDLESAFGELPTQHQPVVYLRFIEGRSHQEIAQTLKIPVNTSQVFAKRGIDKLKQVLGPDSLNTVELGNQTAA